MIPRRLLPLILGLPLAGCAVGPRSPHAAVDLPAPRPAESIAPAAGVAQALRPGQAIPSEWWHAFGSAKLDMLVQQVLARNQDVAAAEATLHQAREQAKAAGSAQGPQIDASYQAERVRVSRAFSNPLAQDPDQYLYALHTAQLTVAYPLDLFGGGRNKVRSARAAADVAAARRIAARSTAVANLVLAVIQHASLEAQIAATQSAIQSSRELVDLLERRRMIGDVGEADVAAQQAALASVEATLPPLERQREHQAALVVTLTGRAAGNSPPSLPSLAELTLPTDLPLALPADVVARRPDVAAAAAQMRGAAADLGTAIAARLPAVQLTGSAGGAATHFLDMFASGNPFFTLLGGVTQPIFHSGQLLHQQRAAEAALRAAEAQYRAAALQAFLDVDDALAGLRADAAALDAASRADSAARRSLAMMRRQVELGAQGTLSLLTASSAASQASVQMVQARAARLSDTVALFQASGTDVRTSSRRD